MKATKKTNAIRILDTKKVDYNTLGYEVKDGKIDGISVAGKINKGVEQVYKTLVTWGTSKEIYVFVIPVAMELDLKKAAIAAGEKKIEMIPVADITKRTGYVKGGCSPIGMKKLYKTFLDSSAKQLHEIVVSAGRIGAQIELSPVDLVNIVQGEFKDVIK